MWTLVAILLVIVLAPLAFMVVVELWPLIWRLGLWILGLGALLFLLALGSQGY